MGTYICYTYRSTPLSFTVLHNLATHFMQIRCLINNRNATYCTTVVIKEYIVLVLITDTLNTLCYYNDFICMTTYFKFNTATNCLPEHPNQVLDTNKFLVHTFWWTKLHNAMSECALFGPE